MFNIAILLYIYIQRKFLVTTDLNRKEAIFMGFLFKVPNTFDIQN